MGSTTGSIILTKKGRQVTAGSTAPSNPKLNEIWLDTAEHANILKYFNGTSWIKVNDVSDEFTDVYETLHNSYYTKTETADCIATQIGSATITKSDGTTVNMKNALNEVIDTASGHTQTIQSMQSELSENKNGLSALQSNVSAFTQDLDGFKLDVSKTYTTKDEFDSLAIGCRNLALGTENWSGGWLEKGNIVITGNTVSVPVSDTPKYTPIFVKSGETLTISIDISSDTPYIHDNSYGPVLLDWLNDNNERISYTWAFQNIGITGSWKRFSLSVTVPEHVTKLSIGLRSTAGYVNKFRFLKIEKGNKPTDWSPAPEDIDSELLSVRSSITQNADKIALVVEGTDSSGNVVLTNNALDIIADNIDLTGKVTFNSLDNSMQNKVNHAVEAADAANSKIDTLEIDGTNLLLNCNQYTADNKLKIHATKDNYFEIKSAKVILENGKPYTFSCKTDGIWGGGTDDTVEAYLLLDGQYQTYFRLDSNEKFTFTAPDSGEYYLRVDVNKNGMTHYFWNLKIEKGTQATDYSPNPMDMAATIESVKNTADSAHLWVAANGSDMTDLRTMVLKWTSDAVSDGTTTIQGGWINAYTITSDKIASNSITADKIMAGAITGDKIAAGTITGSHIHAGAITAASGIIADINADTIKAGTLKGITLQSTNYEEAVGTLNPLMGSKLNLADGSFKSRNLRWDSSGNVTAHNLNATNAVLSGKVTATSGKIGGWNIETNGALRADTDTGTAPGTMNRLYLQPFTKEHYEDTWVISSQYFGIDSSGIVSQSGNAYWYITGYGNFYTMGEIDAGQIKARGGITSQGGLMLHNGGLELYSTTPYIDFHAENSGADYTARIINTSGGTLLAYNTISNVSDQRLKKEITPLDNRYINVLNALKPVSYRFIKGDKYLNVGFIAQDVEQSFLRNGITDMPIVSKENDDIYALDYNQITALCVMGYQEHEKRIMELENQLSIANTLIQNFILQQQNDNVSTDNH